VQLSVAEISSISEKIGYADQALLNWVHQTERELGLKLQSTVEEREKIRAFMKNTRGSPASWPKRPG